MRCLRILGALALALVMAGCVPSLHPLYTEKDVVFDPSLLGTWGGKEDEDRDTWTFEKGKGESYKLIYTEKAVPAEFRAHLVRLGKFRFLDVYPEAPDITHSPFTNGFYAVHVVPAHTFLRIKVEGDILYVAVMHPDRFGDSLDRKAVKIAHVRLEDGFVLTASTKELQQFVLKYAEDPNIFGDPAELVRKR